MGNRISYIAIFFTFALAVTCDQSPFYFEDDYKDTELNLLEVISVGNEDRVLPADGFSKVEIKVVAPKTWDSKEKKAVIVTTGGTLEGGTRVNDFSIEIDFKSDTANFYLVSSDKKETVRLDISLKENLSITESISFEFTEINADDLLRFESPGSGAVFPADGETQVELVLYLSPDMPNSSNRVKLTTTHGKFSENGLNTIDESPNQNGEIIVFLTAHTTNTNSRITAENGAIQKDLYLEFENAGPDVISISIARDSLRIPYDEKFSFSVDLIRNVGKVTEGVLLTATARDTVGNLLGQFDKQFYQVLSSNETIGLNYYPSLTSYRGDVEITINNNANATVSSIVIEIID